MSADRPLVPGPCCVGRNLNTWCADCEAARTSLSLDLDPVNPPAPIPAQNPSDFTPGSRGAAPLPPKESSATMTASTTTPGDTGFLPDGTRVRDDQGRLGTVVSRNWATADTHERVLFDHSRIILRFRRDSLVIATPRDTGYTDPTTEVFSPGAYLRDELAERGITHAQFAEAVGISRPLVSQIVHGRVGITTEMAFRLASELGTSPELWLNLQTAWRCAEYRRLNPSAAR